MKFLKSIERNGKLVLAKLVSILIPNGKTYDDLYGKKDEIKKILIIRLESKLGNIVMTTFLPESLKEIYPDAEVHLFIHDMNNEIWKDNPHQDKMFVYDPIVHLRNPLNFLSLARNIRKENYDLVMDYSTPGGFSVSNALMTRFIGRKYRVGYRRGMSEEFLNITVDVDKNLHYIETNRSLLRILDKNITDFKPRIYLPEDKKEISRSFLEEEFGGSVDSYNLYWVGARRDKQWGLKNFEELKAKVDEETKVRSFLVCGPAEKHFYDEYTARGYKDVIYLNDFYLLTSLISNCSTFISGDAGPLHLAYALGKQTVGIYLVRNYDVYGYVSGETNMVVDIADDPENEKNSDEVYKTVMTVINSSSGNAD